MTPTHLSTHLVNLLGLNDIMIVSFRLTSSNILLSSMSFLPSNHHSKNCSSLSPGSLPLVYKFDIYEYGSESIIVVD